MRSTAEMSFDKSLLTHRQLAFGNGGTERNLAVRRKP
jgi:hypothetical protein